MVAATERRVVRWCFCESSTLIEKAGLEQMYKVHWRLQIDLHAPSRKKALPSRRCVCKDLTGAYSRLAQRKAATDSHQSGEPTRGI